MARYFVNIVYEDGNEDCIPAGFVPEDFDEAKDIARAAREADAIVVFISVEP